MKLAAIINPMSRSVPEDAADALEAAVREAGHNLVQLGCSHEALVANVQAAASGTADAVIAWGGDGTLACTLTACGPSGPPVLVLPGGTMNMLPHRLHGNDADWREILDRVLRAPVVGPIAAGTAGDHRFYVAALFGKLTAMAESREAVRKGDVLEAAQAVLTGDVLDCETRLRITSRHRMGEQMINAVAAAIGVSSEQAAALEVAAIDPDSTLEMLATAVDALIHGWRKAEPVERDVSHSLTIHDLSDSPIPATLDGEPVLFDTPVEIRILDKAARVLRAEADH